ncbi:hypothetical protein HanPI659440_Chr14g0545931 [Helianthus annuus]|nr:hypothetical protein HanPI659440_Chr14g0545931 [Helianthus annuus]
MAIVSDNEILSESEVYTSDTTSTDEDDFQPFALPDDTPLADGPFDGDLPLVPIPAPIPLAAFTLEDLPLDALSDDDIDLFIEGPPEGDQDGGAPMEDDVPVDGPVAPIAEAPVEEAPSDPSAPDSFESVASAFFHDRGVHHYSPDADSDMAMSAAPVVPQDFGPEPEVEFVPAEHAPVGPKPVIGHDPIDVPVFALLPDPLPESDYVVPPVMAPHVVMHQSSYHRFLMFLLLMHPFLHHLLSTMHHLPHILIPGMLTPLMGGLMMMMTILCLFSQSLHPLHLLLHRLIFPSSTLTHLMSTAQTYPSPFYRTYPLPVQGKDLLLGHTITCHPRQQLFHLCPLLLRLHTLHLPLYHRESHFCGHRPMLWLCQTPITLSMSDIPLRTYLYPCSYSRMR